MYCIALACVSVFIASGCCQGTGHSDNGEQSASDHPSADSYPSITTATTHDSRWIGRSRHAITFRPRYRPTTPGPQKFDFPDICNTSYDAITMLRKELFVFKGPYLWRVGNNGAYPGYPVEIRRFFQQLADVDHINAVYERSGDKKIHFLVRTLQVSNQMAHDKDISTSHRHQLQQELR